MQAPAQYSARLVPFSPGWYWARLTIRLLILLVAASIWGLVAYHMTMSFLVLPVLISDLVWQSAELIVLATRWSTKRGVHPAVQLVEDLVHLLAYLAVAVLYEINAIQWTQFENVPVAWAIIGALLFLEFAFHLALFIRDCVEVHQRRKSKSFPNVTYYIPGHGAPFVVNPDFMDMDVLHNALQSTPSVSSAAKNF